MRQPLFSYIGWGCDLGQSELKDVTYRKQLLWLSALSCSVNRHYGPRGACTRPHPNLKSRRLTCSTFIVQCCANVCRLTQHWITNGPFRGFWAASKACANHEQPSANSTWSPVKWAGITTKAGGVARDKGEATAFKFAAKSWSNRLIVAFYMLNVL